MGEQQAGAQIQEVSLAPVDFHCYLYLNGSFLLDYVGTSGSYPEKVSILLLMFRYLLLLLGMATMLVIAIKFLLSARIDSTVFNREQGTLTLSRYGVLS